MKPITKNNDLLDQYRRISENRKLLERELSHEKPPISPKEAFILFLDAYLVENFPATSAAFPPRHDSIVYVNEWVKSISKIDFLHIIDIFDFAQKNSIPFEPADDTAYRRGQALESSSSVREPYARTTSSDNTLFDKFQNSDNQDTAPLVCLPDIEPVDIPKTSNPLEDNKEENKLESMQEKITLPIEPELEKIADPVQPYEIPTKQSPRMKATDYDLYQLPELPPGVDWVTLKEISELNNLDHSSTIAMIVEFGFASRNCGSYKPSKFAYDSGVCKIKEIRTMTDGRKHNRYVWRSDLFSIIEANKDYSEVSQRL